MTPFVTAGAGFLLAVLWFDLMHDVQVVGHADDDVPAEALDSIAGYYRRVTTDARPMNRLVSVSMVATIGALVAQLVAGDTETWVAAASLALVTAAVLLAVARTVRNAVRLGGRRDPVGLQSRLARAVFHDHLFCATAVTAVLVLELAFAR